MAGNGNGSADLTSASTGHAGVLLAYRVPSPNHGQVVMPFRGYSVGVDTCRSLLAGRVNPDLPMFQVRMNGATIILTLRDLKMAP